MLTDADDREYNRNVTAYDATYQHRNQMYNEAYTQYRDNKSDAFNMANLQLSENAQIVNNAYNLYNATSNYADTLYEREYSKWADEVNQAMQYAGILNSDWWNQTNYDRGVFESDRAYEQTEKWNQKDDDYRYAALKQADDHHNDDMGYKYSALAQDQAQFEATMEWNKTKAANNESGYVTKKDENGNEVKLKNPTETQHKKALEAYNAEGMDGLNKYLNSVSDEYDKDSIAEYVGEYGELPLEKRTYTKTKDTNNWFWGIDNNDIVKDQYGNEYRIDELPESIRKELTKLEQGKSYTKK